MSVFMGCQNWKIWAGRARAKQKKWPLACYTIKTQSVDGFGLEKTKEQQQQQHTKSIKINRGWRAPDEWMMKSLSDLIGTIGPVRSIVHSIELNHRPCTISAKWGFRFYIIDAIAPRWLAESENAFQLSAVGTLSQSAPGVWHVRIWCVLEFKLNRCVCVCERPCGCVANGHANPT